MLARQQGARSQSFCFHQLALRWRNQRRYLWRVRRMGFQTARQKPPHSCLRHPRDNSSSTGYRPRTTHGETQWNRSPPHRCTRPCAKGDARVSFYFVCSSNSPISFPLHRDNSSKRFLFPPKPGRVAFRVFPSHVLIRSCLVSRSFALLSARPFPSRWITQSVKASI